MKILLFGNSHVGAFKQAYTQIIESKNDDQLYKELFNFCTQNEITFASVPGPNWRDVDIGNTSVVTIPKTTYSYNRFKERTDKILYINDFDSFNTFDYDCIVWCKGLNPVSVYHEFFESVSHPSLLTTPLIKILFDENSLGSQFIKLISSNTTCHFIYCGSPIRFLENSPERIDESAVIEEIHSRNIKFLRTCHSDIVKFSLLVPPMNCVHHAGRFTYDRFARKPGKDLGHANALYGIEMFKQIKSVLKK